MKKPSHRLIGVGMLAFAAVVTAVVATSTSAVAGGFKPCFQGQCLDVWNPVVCSNGVTYSNACYAARACQYNCSGGGV